MCVEHYWLIAVNRINVGLLYNLKNKINLDLDLEYLPNCVLFFLLQIYWDLVQSICLP